MAIAGSGIPTMKVKWQGGALRSVGYMEHTPVGTCFSVYPGGMGTLDEAARQLHDGVTVRIDMRSGQYLQLRDMMTVRMK